MSPRLVRIQPSAKHIHHQQRPSETLPLSNYSVLAVAWDSAIIYSIRTIIVWEKVGMNNSRMLPIAVVHSSILELPPRSFLYQVSIRKVWKMKLMISFFTATRCSRGNFSELLFSRQSIIKLFKIQLEGSFSDRGHNYFNISEYCRLSSLYPKAEKVSGSRRGETHFACLQLDSEWV